MAKVGTRAKGQFRSINPMHLDPDHDDDDADDADDDKHQAYQIFQNLKREA